MEILVGIVMIVIILLLAGVDMWYFLVGGAVLVAAAALFTTAFFIVCAVMLLHSRRCTGVFLRFAEGKRFDAAEYLIDGEPHRNVFPAEFVMRERLYCPDKTVKLHLTRSGRVFDGNALVTTIIGLPLSLLTAVAFGAGALILTGII